MKQGEPPVIGLARLLEVVELVELSRGYGPYTRELLGYLRMWGYGESILMLAWDLGLVERYDGKCPDGVRVCRFNRLSAKGRRFLRHYRELLRLMGL